MRKLLRGLGICTAAMLLPLSCLMLYAQLLLPDGGLPLGEPLYSVIVSAASSKSVGSAAGGKAIPSQLKLWGLLPIRAANAPLNQRRYVIPGGQVFGLKLYAKGVVVVAIDSVAGISGKENPAERAGLLPGDLLLEIDGEAVTRNAQVSAAVEQSGGRQLSMLIERGGEQRKISFTPTKCGDGTYKAGIWVRDSSAGIGTVTFKDPQTNMLAGLGHAICDVDSGALIPISAGEAVPAVVKGCYKGTGGKPGELCGVFNGKAFAGLIQNGDTGVYGRLYAAPDEASLRLPIAMGCEVKTGKAQIIATIDGETAGCFSVEIRKVYQNSGGSQKNMIIEVTDKKLLAATGGIVQGMSGSPILQNGMLVGAVTHVFVNNPAQGYGIFAETMLQTADSLCAGQEALAPAA